MRRNYNFQKISKKHIDDKIAGICAIIVLICIICTYMFCTSMKQISSQTASSETSDDVPVEQTEQQQVGNENGEPSSVSTMIKAGQYCADMQNEMIKENDAYLLEVQNAVNAGYYERIIMSERYQELLDTFDKKYMQDIPIGSGTVMWSEYGVWEFAADYDYSTELNASMPAVWVCYDKTDTDKKHPYAIVTATYITSTGKFIEPRLSKTEWYPDHSALYDSIADEEVVPDQCGDMDAVGGGNDEANMTQEQLEAWQELQKLMAGEAVKEDAVTISH